jgi:hypothetical protein
MMTDRQTGQPVANACLTMVAEDNPRSLLWGGGPCSGPDGSITASRLRAGTYKAFVWARDGVHGHQWVGNDRGVGTWRQATTITVSAGSTTAMPTVRLDGKGGVTGTITDEITGQPIQDAAVTFVAFTVDRSGGDAQGVYRTDAQGRYTVPDLGPYQWSFFSGHNDASYAGEWTGDEVDRVKAGHLKVKQDRTVTYDVQLGKGTTITGQILADDGTVVDSAMLWVHDAATGEILAEREMWPGAGTTVYVVQVKGRQEIKLRVEYPGEVREAWFGGTSFATAQVVQVPANGSMELDLTVGG